MALVFHAHPFASYWQKVLIALHENATPFEFRMLDDAESWAALAALWPLRKMPVLVDDGRVVVETSVIIEHLDLYHRGPVRMIPDDPRAALATRMMDRVFDSYVMTPMQAIVADFIRAATDRDPLAVKAARATLDTAYAWLDAAMTGREWAANDSFSLADCAAGPALFYADWVHEIAPRHTHLRTYRARLNARPSFARAIDEARPYRKLFPPGAPDRD